MKSHGSLLTEKMLLTSAVIRYENMTSSQRHATVTQNILLSVTFNKSAFSFIFMLWGINIPPRCLYWYIWISQKPISKPHRLGSSLTLSESQAGRCVVAACTYVSVGLVLILDRALFEIISCQPLGAWHGYTSDRNMNDQLLLGEYFESLSLNWAPDWCFKWNL